MTDIKDTTLRGVNLLRNPWFNKSSAFTEEERDELGLRGLLPPRVSTFDEQVTRLKGIIDTYEKPINKYIVLEGAHASDETLYFELLGAVLLIDLKGFFPNAPHALLYQRHRELILNPDLQRIADTVIQHSPCPTPGRGMPLGVEPSQQEMVAMPSRIDHWIKCQARVDYEAHYMDDYLMTFPSVDEAKFMGHEIVRRFEAAGIRVNKRKCKVIPLTKPFRFCKARFTLTETGKVKVNGSRDGVKRARRKLKLFHKEFKEGKRTFFDIEQYMECQSAYYRNFNDHGRSLRLRRLYHAIFFGGAECLESSKTGPLLA